MSPVKEKARQAYRDQQCQDTEGGCQGNGDCFISGFMAGYRQPKDCVDYNFKAWVVLDENNKAICYLDESLGEKLEESKRYHERKNYKIIELQGEIK